MKKNYKYICILYLYALCTVYLMILYFYRELLYVTLKKLNVTLYIYSSSFFPFFKVYSEYKYVYLAKTIKIYFLTYEYKNYFLIQTRRQQLFKPK